MKRFLGISLFFILMASFMLLGTVATHAQTAPTPTAVPVVVPPAPNNNNVDAALREIQRANAEAMRQIENVNSMLALVQGVTLLFVVLAVIAALFGIMTFIEYRANLSKSRELLSQVVDETKQMRVVQEAVKMRLGDLETLDKKVDDTLAGMQNTIRDQLQVVNETSAMQGREIDEATQGMKNQLRDQLQIVYDRSDKQLKLLMDVLNNQLRDLNTVRKDVDTATQDLRGQIRDQLQGVNDRHDKHVKDVLDMHGQHRREVDATRQDLVAANQASRQEMVAASQTSRQELATAAQAVRDQVRDQLQIVYDRGDKQLKDLIELHNQHRHEVDITRQEMSAASQDMRNQIRDELQKVYERSDQQMKALQLVLTNHMKDFDTLRKEITDASQSMRDQVSEALQVVDSGHRDVEALRVRVEELVHTLEPQPEVNSANAQPEHGNARGTHKSESAAKPKAD